MEQITEHPGLIAGVLVSCFLAGIGAWYALTRWLLSRLLTQFENRVTAMEQRQVETEIEIRSLDRKLSDLMPRDEVIRLHERQTSKLERLEDKMESRMSEINNAVVEIRDYIINRPRNERRSD